MRKIFTFLIMIFIFYTVFQNNKNEILKNIPDRSSQAEERENDNNSQDESLNEKTSIDQKKEQEAKESYDVQKAIEEKLNNPSGGFVERVVSNALTSVMKTEQGREFTEKLLRPIDPDLKSSTIAISVSDFNPVKRRYNTTPIALGQGDKAVCGQNINLHSIVVEEDANGRRKPVNENLSDYLVGEHSIAEFNILPIGMNVGEINSYEYLSQRNSTGKKLNLVLRLVDIKTPKKYEPNKIKIFDDYISSSDPITCGDSVKFRLKILNMEGNIVEETELKLKVGDKNYPLVLHHILTNKPTLGIRTVIMPAQYLNDLPQKLSQIDKLKENLMLLEIDNVVIYPKNYTDQPNQ